MAALSVVIGTAIFGEISPMPDTDEETDESPPLW